MSITGLFQILGIMGALATLVAYLYLKKGWLKSDSLWYDLLNVLGSSLLLAAAIYQNSIGFMLLNASWLAIALIGVRRYFQKP